MLLHMMIRKESFAWFSFPGKVAESKLEVSLAEMLLATWRSN